MGSLFCCTLFSCYRREHKRRGLIYLLTFPVDLMPIDVHCNHPKIESIGTLKNEPWSDLAASSTRYNAVRHHSVRQIDPRLKAIVVDQLGVEEQEVVPNASLVEDLDADSLDRVEFIMELEEHFHLEIPDENAEILTTVGESQTYLEIKGVL